MSIVKPFASLYINQLFVAQRQLGLYLEIILKAVTVEMACKGLLHETEELVLMEKEVGLDILKI